MAIEAFRGNFHVEYFPKTASTAFAIGDAVSILPTAAGAGTLIKTTSTSPSITGIILKKVASTDADYASTTLVPVLVGDVDAIWQAATTGAATTDIGEFVDAADAVSLNVASYTYGVAEVKEVLSATSVLVKICKKQGPAITTA